MRKIKYGIALGFSLLLFIALCPNKVSCQDAKRDKKAKQKYEEGKRLFEKKNHPYAAKKFQKVAAPNFNLHTTPAIYMAGLCYFYLNDYEKAMTKFQYLLETYP